MLFVSNSNLVFQRATFQNFTRTIKIGLVVSLDSSASYQVIIMIIMIIMITMITMITMIIRYIF